MNDQETSKAIQAKMLATMNHYRVMLHRVLIWIPDADPMRAVIERELALNPEWEVLEHFPHGHVVTPDFTVTGPDHE